MQIKTASKTAKTTFVVLLLLLTLLFFIYAFRVLLLILGGALIALFFDGIASFIHKKIPKNNQKDNNYI
mgnify:CR=1 FL=1